MRANFRTTIVDHDFNEWQVEATIIAETALGGQHPDGAYEELIVSAAIRCLEFTHEGRYLHCESLVDLPTIFNAKMERRIEVVAREALELEMNPHPTPQELGIIE